MTVGETLVVNSQAVIKVEREEGAITAVTVRAPVKGGALKVTTIDRAAEPQLFGTLLVSAAAADAIAQARLTADERARLADIGLLIPPDRCLRRSLLVRRADSRPSLLRATAGNANCGRRG